jgi:hypothetical protein
MVMSGLVGCKLPVSVANGLGVSIHSTFTMQSNVGMKRQERREGGKAKGGEDLLLENTIQGDGDKRAEKRADPILQTEQ